jgi:hypothetical protein
MIIIFFFSYRLYNLKIIIMNSWHFYNSNPSNLVENTYFVKNCSAIPHIPPINEVVVAASSTLKRQNAKLSLNLMKRKIKSKRNNKMNSSRIKKINPKDILSSTRINNNEPISKFPLSSFFYESPISSTIVQVQEKEKKMIKKRYINNYNHHQHQRGSNKTAYSNCCCSNRNYVYPINYNNKMFENVVSSTFSSNQLKNNIYPNSSSLLVNGGLSKNEKFNNFGDIFVWYV